MTDYNAIKNLITSVQQPEKGLKVDELAIEASFKKMREAESGIAIKLLSIFGGLLASLSFAAFIGISNIYKSTPALLTIGMILIIAALWLTKVYDKLIIDTSAIAAFVIGYIMLVWGFNNLEWDKIQICLVIILLATISLCFCQNYMIAFLSVLLISGSLLTIIFTNRYNYELIHVYVSLMAVILTTLFLRESYIITKYRKISRLYRPVQVALVFSFLAGLFCIGKKNFIDLSQANNWISSLIITACLLYVVSLVIKFFKVSGRNKTFIYLLSLLILGLSAPAPAIQGALLIILLSFFSNDKTGLVAGIISFVYFVSQFYYDLSFTLLTKSILLMASGVLFLAFYFLLSKAIAANEKI